MTAHVIFRIFILLLYYIVVVSQHENFGKFLAKNISKPFGRDVFNNISIAATILGLLFIGFLIQKRLKSFGSDQKRILLTYLLTTLFLLFAAWQSIFVLNVEFIHVFQYAFLAILLYPLINHFSYTILISTLFGAVDELYQYMVLTPNNAYYDLNDVVINFFGAVIGSIFFLIVFYDKIVESNKKVIERLSIIFGTFLTLLIIGLLTGYLAIGPEIESHNLFSFYRKPVPEYWHITPPDISYHVLHPAEFVVYMLVLFVLYHKLGTTIKCKH